MTTAEAQIGAVFERTLLAFASIGLARDVVWGRFDRARLEMGYASFDALAEAGPRAIGDVWAKAYETLPPFSALFAGASVPAGAYAVVDYLAASCASMAEGTAKLARYFKLVRPDVSFVLTEDEHAAHVELDDRRREDWFFDEWTIGITVQRFRAATGRVFPLVGARFRRPAAEGIDLGKVVSFLGTPPVLGAKAGGFSVDLDVWRTPLVLRDERMRESLEAHAERILREQESGAGQLRIKVREVVARQLRGGDPSVQATARSLGLTSRTLQRRLSDDGVSYQALVDEVRAELAGRYLDSEGLSVTEVAFLLGYSEASAFARAYKRWTGKSPTEARRQ